MTWCVYNKNINKNTLKIMMMMLAVAAIDAAADAVSASPRVFKIL